MKFGIDLSLVVGAGRGVVIGLRGTLFFLCQRLAHRWTRDTILTNGIWKEVLGWFLGVFLISNRAPQEIILQGNVSEGPQALIALGSRMITSRTFFGEKSLLGMAEWDLAFQRLAQWRDGKNCELTGWCVFWTSKPPLLWIIFSLV